MATLGFPIYISIILCLTVKTRSDLTTINAISELNNMITNLNNSVASINVRIDNLEKLSNTNNADNTKKDAITKAGDVDQTKERMIKALLSEKFFVSKSLSAYEGKFKDFQKKMIEQMNVINSTSVASHDNLERVRAENVANLNSWNKSQENYLNRLETAVNNATIKREALLIELQQSIDQVATNTSTKLESVEMKIYESLHSRTEEIWASTGICPIPFDIDKRLSVKYELSSSSRVDVREGDTIRNQEYALFNCSNVIEQKYEPANRRFQCVRGQWMEADRNPNWTLGNNGAFPECREAICDPPCENDGVCFRDGLCRCEHMTTGERCQTVLCHEDCTKNGGECVKPGTCGNCPKSRHGENCERANDCEIPFDIDRRLSVYQWSPRLYLTEGDKISDQSYVFFNCSNVIEIIYEPANRRFQCVRGKWMEAHRGSVWKSNYNGRFPECREAICDPPCKNGGVCFRDGECKCQHMTTGAICETLLCDETCAKNGGECVKPGICGNCPISRRGDNCEREKTDFKYVVRILVAGDGIAGTHNNIYVRIYGQEEHTPAFRMNGDFFSRNRLVEGEFRGIDVRPIQRVAVSKDNGTTDDQLSIFYVSIFVEDSDEYYVFTYRDQPDALPLSASLPVELSISQHPEHCIHTYGEAMYGSPRGNLGPLLGYMSQRECKQRCVTTRSILCNSIFFMPWVHVIDKRGFGHCYHNTHSPDSNYFRDNTRAETRYQNVSYKRICREP